MTSFPIVNINGDSIETLLGQHQAVYKAAMALREALAQAAPHGRNYQTMPPVSVSAARYDWIQHNDAVKAVQDWAEHYLNELLRQAHERMSSSQVGELCMKVLR